MRLAVLLVIVAACSRHNEPRPSPDPPQVSTLEMTARPLPPVTPQHPKPRPHVETNDTNIHRADYIGPEACGTCHPDEHKRWSASLHPKMNQLAGAAAIIGDFADAKIPYAGGEARFTHDKDGYWMTTAKAARVTRYRVTRTIGIRALQEYVGIEDGRTDEVRLPFGWWPRLGRWVPQPYYDPWLGEETKFDAYAPVREPWAERCPWCHSTYPFDQRIERSTAPPHHRGHGLEQYFTAAASPGNNVERVPIEQQITTGISCESCHLGGKGHQAGGSIDFVPRGAEAKQGAPIRRPFAEERADAKLVNGVCLQCHSGPSPKLADGTSLRNSAEGRDMEAGKCTGLACTGCHDPHAGGSDDARSIATCKGCHKTIDDKHAHHKTVSCLDCHMPKVVMGIDHFVRAHRISSPTHVAVNEPNACNLCHLDRSLAWTVDELKVYGTQVPRDTAWPELEAGTVWLAGKRTYLRLIAEFAYARSPLGTQAKLAPFLDDKLAYVRTWTKFAIEDLVKHKIDVPNLVH